MTQETKEITCVDFAKSIFSKDILRIRLYNEDISLSTLLVESKTVDCYFHNTKKTQALVSLTYSSSNNNSTNEVAGELSNMNLLVFSNIESIRNAFESWNNDFKFKTFKGKAPLTIAIDVDKGNIYVLFVDSRDDVVELSLFAHCNKEELEQILPEVSNDKPFTFHIDNSILMDICVGDEGYNHAYRNVELILNCSVPLRVKATETKWTVGLNT